MFRAFIMWCNDVVKWIRNQKFNNDDDIWFFCTMFLLTGLVITIVLALAWITTIGKIMVGVFLVMLFIFINCKYNDQKDTDCG